jgi:capsular exopolysaccharide synthesis family protein
MGRVHDAMQRAGLRPAVTAAAVTAPAVAKPAPGGDREPAVVTAVKQVGDAISRDTVLDPAIDPVVVDEFRKLASAVHQAQVAQDLKLLTIASGTAEEGKSLTALNLALTLASSYNKQVLLIDADLRAPSVAMTLDLPAAPGLTDLLNAPSGSSWPLHKATPMLSILTAGQRTRDPISRISAPRMKEFLTLAREQFDAILVDTPPVGPFPDAALLSAMSDATILVVSAGQASYKVAQRAVEVIGEEKILGVVLNRVAWAAFDESYGYYGRYRHRK